MEDSTTRSSKELLSLIQFSHSNASLTELIEVPNKIDKILALHIHKADLFLDKINVQLCAPHNPRKIVKKITEANTYSTLETTHEVEEGQLHSSTKSANSCNTFNLNLNESTLFKRRKKANTTSPISHNQMFSTLSSIQTFSTVDGITVPIDSSEIQKKKLTFDDHSDGRIIKNLEEFL